MINISKISKKSFLGYFSRLLLKIIPNETVMPILQGSLKGFRWVKGSGVNAYWLGTYEIEQQQIFTDKIKLNDTVFDIGANVGFYSLIASKIVGPEGNVYAFEPAPQNLHYLKKHFDLNSCTNSKVFVGGVSDKKSIVYFNDGSHAATGFLSKESSGLLVPVFQLDELVESKTISEPNVIKIDVEGAEFDVLNGALKTLEKCHPTIFLSTHNDKVHQQCLTLLRSLEYKLVPLHGSDIEKSPEIMATY